MKKKILHSILFTLCFIASNAYAVDMAVLQEQCADIGFKIRTPATCIHVNKLIPKKI